MPTLYPSSLDSFANPGAATLEDAPGFYHDEQHANANDAVEAVQVKLGISETSAADTPVAGTVLQSLTGGRSKWAKLTSAMIQPGQAPAQIQTHSLGASASEITFAAIPTSFQHLVVHAYVRSTVSAVSDVVYARFNGNLTANYNSQIMYGSAGSTAASEQLGSNFAQIGACAGASASFVFWTPIVLHLPGYRHGSAGRNWSSTTGMAYGSATGQMQARLASGALAVAGALTDLSIGTVTGQLLTGSILTLYGYN